MEKNRFDFTIDILKNVSFAPDLFCKEVEKAFRVLLPYETEQLIEWLETYLEEKPELKNCQILLDIY